MTMVKFFTASLVSVLVLESSAHAVCGNGVLDAGEACEDGNTTNGDGCDDTCAIESGWDCTEAIFELDFYENYTQTIQFGVQAVWLHCKTIRKLYSFVVKLQENYISL